jgi:hypothetical protein
LAALSGVAADRPPVDTEFLRRRRHGPGQDTKVGTGDKDDSADVARDGFQALMNGDERVVSHSFSSKAQGSAAGCFPTASRPRCIAR